MTDDQHQVLQHRVSEIEADIERLFERTKDLNVTERQLQELHGEIKAMRKENSEQHNAGKHAIDSLRGQFVTGLIALAGTFAAALAAVLARGI